MGKFGAPPRCQQILRVETPYWREAPECRAVAAFTWQSPLRGLLRLCRRHAKVIGLDKCGPISGRKAAAERIEK
jgi:hypothetical protein